MSTNRFFKELGKAVVIGTVIYLGLLVYFYFTGIIDKNFGIAEAWEEYYTNMVYSIILYMANAFWIVYLLKRYDFNLYTPKRLTTSIVGNIILSLLGIFVSRIIIKVFIYGVALDRFLTSEKLSSYQLSMVIVVIISATFYAFWYYRNRQETKVKEQKIIAGTASAKFDALKNQLDPHFLFNSLNVLTSLIEEDPYQAQKFTTSLSKVYRYVLEQKNKDLVSVDEELQFAKTYVRLLKMRFEDSIVFDIPEKSAYPEAKIVPLSLQLLLENAVKHNVVTAERPLHIKVFEKDGMLVVSNNLQEKQVVKKSTGVGLQNINDRYAILTERKVYIEKTNTDFQVHLPMLTKQISVRESQEEYLEDKRYEKAKERVQKIKGFYGNLFAYCLVIPFLIFINVKSGGFPWSLFPALGWGFGLTAHGFEAFGYNPLFGRSWEERKMQEFMDDENF